MQQVWKGYASPGLNPDLLFNEHALFQICHFLSLLWLEMEVSEISDYKLDECRKL